MRRGGALAWSIVLLLAASLVLPGADAQRGLRDLSPLPKQMSESDDEDDDAPQKRAAPGSGGGAPRVTVTLAGLVLMLVFLAGAGLLVAGLVAARRSRGRKPKAPPKKSFDAGRLAGQRAAPAAAHELAPILQKADLGRVLDLRAEARGLAVSLQRRRAVRCEHAAGFLLGLAETLWAADAEVQHVACGGKKAETPCVYRLVRRPSPVELRGLSGSAAPGAPASTPGSAAGRHRWPPARPGGG